MLEDEFVYESLLKIIPELKWGSDIEPLEYTSYSSEFESYIFSATVFGGGNTSYSFVIATKGEDMVVESFDGPASSKASGLYHCVIAALETQKKDHRQQFYKTLEKYLENHKK